MALEAGTLPNHTQIVKYLTDILFYKKRFKMCRWLFKWHDVIPKSKPTVFNW